MPRIPGVNRLDVVRALQKAGFVVVRRGKIVRDAGLTAEQFRDLL